MLQIQGYPPRGRAHGRGSEKPRDLGLVLLGMHDLIEKNYGGCWKPFTKCKARYYKILCVL
jgi:hypothetical protein